VQRIVLDTSIIIDHIRQPDKPETVFTQLLQKYSLIIALITVTELFSGSSIQKLKERERLETILSVLDIYIPDMNLARQSGLLRGIRKIATADAQIAMTAIILKLPLATLDTRDFAKIPDLQLLPLPSFS